MKVKNETNIILNIVVGNNYDEDPEIDVNLRSDNSINIPGDGIMVIRLGEIK